MGLLTVVRNKLWELKDRGTLLESIPHRHVYLPQERRAHYGVIGADFFFLTAPVEERTSPSSLNDLLRQIVPTDLREKLEREHKAKVDFHDFSKTGDWLTLGGIEIYLPDIGSLGHFFEPTEQGVEAVALAGLDGEFESKMEVTGQHIRFKDDVKPIGLAVNLSVYPNGEIMQQSNHIRPGGRRISYGKTRINLNRPYVRRTISDRRSRQAIRDA